MKRQERNKRWSFTLVELLMSISIISLLAATALFALYGVQEHAKEARTKSEIARLHSIIMTEWEQYLTMTLPLRIPPAFNLAQASQARLLGLREMQRMQLPDRKSDLLDGPAVLRTPGTNQPLLLSRYLSYQRKTDRIVKAVRGPSVDWRDDVNGWTRVHQGSECLYLILSSIRDGDSTGLDGFTDSEIGDTDGDGMREILDGWGRPIEFIRWAPGFVTNPGPDGGWGQAGTDDDGNGTVDDELEAGFPGTDDGSEAQPRDPTLAPDPFDVRGIDGRATFALVPLIFSAGSDGVYDIASDFGSGAIRFATTSPLNDPYLVESTTTNIQLGRPVDADDANNSGRGDGILQCWDNISNHLIEAK